MNYYLMATRLPFLSASLLPVMLASVMFITGIHQLRVALLAAVTVASLHLSANTLNDYVDWEGTDKDNPNSGPFSGGSRHLVEGKLKRRSFLILGVILAVIGISCLLYLTAIRPYVIFIGTIGAVLGIGYSVPPLRLQSRGLGELAIFFAFGPLITLGTGYAVTGMFSLTQFLAGVPLGLFVTAILWINEFPDYEADTRNGKRNLVVRLGKRNARKGFVVILLAAYTSICALVVVDIFPRLALLSLLTFPLAAKIVRGLSENYNKHKALVPYQGNTILLHILVSIILIVAVIAVGSPTS